MLEMLTDRDYLRHRVSVSFSGTAFACQAKPTYTLSPFTQSTLRHHQALCRLGRPGVCRLGDHSTAERASLPARCPLAIAPYTVRSQPAQQLLLRTIAYFYIVVDASRGRSALQ